MLALRAPTGATKAHRPLASRMAVVPRAAVANGTGSSASHLDKMNQAIGRHIKKAALAASATRVARMNQDLGHHIKLAAKAAAAGKLKPKGPPAPPATGKAAAAKAAK